MGAVQAPPPLLAAACRAQHAMHACMVCSAVALCCCLECIQGSNAMCWAACRLHPPVARSFDAPLGAPLLDTACLPPTNPSPLLLPPLVQCRRCTMATCCRRAWCTHRWRAACSARCDSRAGQIGGAACCAALGGAEAWHERVCLSKQDGDCGGSRADLHTVVSQYSVSHLGPGSPHPAHRPASSPASPFRSAWRWQWRQRARRYGRATSSRARRGRAASWRCAAHAVHAACAAVTWGCCGRRENCALFPACMRVCRIACR